MTISTIAKYRAGLAGPAAFVGPWHIKCSAAAPRLPVTGVAGGDHLVLRAGADEDDPHRNPPRDPRPVTTTALAHLPSVSIRERPVVKEAVVPAVTVCRELSGLLYQPVFFWR